MTNSPGAGLNHLTIDGVKQICVVGAGTVGAQIAQVAALKGYLVNLTDDNSTALSRGIENNRNHLQNRVRKGKLTQQQAEEAFARVRLVTSVEEAACQADFVIEATSENLEIKRELFRRLDNICPPHTILVSNSTTFVISKIAADINRKDKVCNMHFFHPALVMELVEVVRCPETSQTTVDLVSELARKMGKEVVIMQKEIFGFIVNNVLFNETDVIKSRYDGNYAAVEDFDMGMQLGLNHRPGAFELAGFTGQEALPYVRQQRYLETGDPRDKPPTFLEEMVEEGYLRSKSNQDFYNYAK
jgi:3-hydroxybutyryl-CoA dehydrogenase